MFIYSKGSMILLTWKGREGNMPVKSRAACRTAKSVSKNFKIFSPDWSETVKAKSSNSSNAIWRVLSTVTQK